MNTTTPVDIKSRVRERYAAIAREDSSCCGTPSETAPSCCASAAAGNVQFVDYGDLQSQVVPGSDLGLGCGTPTQAIPIQAGDIVLDLGSGAGIDAFLAAQSVGPQGRVIGVDMTPEMIERARANAQKVGLANVEFRLGEIEHLPVADNSIDLILSNCVINLVADKSRVFAEMHRVLKPGGQFSVSDMVTLGEVPAEIREDVALWTGCIAGALDREEYLRLLRLAGFRDVRVESESIREAPWNNFQDEAVPEFAIASITVVGRKE